MNKLDEIKKRIEADREQDAAREAEMNAIRAQIDALDKEIDAAIKEGQTGAAEKMIVDQNNLKGKLAIAERISASKTAPDAYCPELMEICSEEMRELQPRIDKATAEMHKARRAYLEKMVTLVKTIREAANFRAECGLLAGIGTLAMNPRFGEFAKVEYTKEISTLNYIETKEIKQLEPEYFLLINDCTFGLR